MKWYSPIAMPDYPFQIDHQTPIIALGSCFAAHIGQRLLDRKFDIQLNPTGILYNPASLQQSFMRLQQGNPFTVDELFYANGLWHSFAHHGRFSHANRSQALAQMNAALASGHQQWQRAGVIIVTLGTAWAYRHKSKDIIVANNHKQPAADFERKLLSPIQIVAYLSAMIEATNQPAIAPHWLLTVSPVRHLKDGAIGNNRSKAHLLTAVHEVVARYDNVHYFPGYELLLDELRDYRFYDTDHVHPSAESIDHIWSRFSAALFSEETSTINQRLMAIRKAMLHRPLHPEGPDYETFKAKQLKQIKAIADQYSFLDLADWTAYFKS